MAILSFFRLAVTDLMRLPARSYVYWVDPSSGWVTFTRRPSISYCEEVAAPVSSVTVSRCPATTGEKDTARHGHLFFAILSLTLEDGGVFLGLQLTAETIHKCRRLQVITRMCGIIVCGMRPGYGRSRMIVEANGIRYAGRQFVWTGYLRHPAQVIQLVLNGIIIEFHRTQRVAEEEIVSSLRAVVIAVCDLHDKLMHLIVEDIILPETLVKCIGGTGDIDQVAIAVIAHIIHRRRTIPEIRADFRNIAGLRIHHAFPPAISGARPCDDDRLRRTDNIFIRYVEIGNGGADIIAGVCCSKLGILGNIALRIIPIGDIVGLARIRLLFITDTTLPAQCYQAHAP